MRRGMRVAREPITLSVVARRLLGTGKVVNKTMGREWSKLLVYCIDGWFPISLSSGIQAAN